MTIASSGPSGAEHAVRELATRLEAYAFDPVVCSLRPAGQVAAEIAARGIPVLSLDMDDDPHLLRLAEGAQHLARWIDELHIDLVHAFLHRATVLSGLAVRWSLRRPCMVACQEDVAALDGPQASPLSRWTTGMVDRVISPTLLHGRLADHARRGLDARSAERMVEAHAGLYAEVLDQRGAFGAPGQRLAAL